MPTRVCSFLRTFESLSRPQVIPWRSLVFRIVSCKCAQTEETYRYDDSCNCSLSHFFQRLDQYWISDFLLPRQGIWLSKHERDDLQVRFENAVSYWERLLQRFYYVLRIVDATFFAHRVPTDSAYVGRSKIDPTPFSVLLTIWTTSFCCSHTQFGPFSRRYPYSEY